MVHPSRPVSSQITPAATRLLNTPDLQPLFCPGGIGIGRFITARWTVATGCFALHPNLVLCEPVLQAVYSLAVGQGAVGCLRAAASWVLA
jgi:hypothetical protein